MVSVEANNRIKRIKQVIYEILDGLTDTTGAKVFRSGTPYYRRNMGPAPLFMLFFESFQSAPPDRSAGVGDTTTTMRFQIELYSLIGANDGDAENRFTDLVTAAVEALQSDHRLRGTCLRSRLSSGQTDLFNEGSNTYWQMVMILEADVPNW